VLVRALITSFLIGTFIRRNRAALGLSRHELALGWNFWFIALSSLVPEEFSGLAFFSKLPPIRWRKIPGYTRPNCSFHVASGRTFLNPAMEESGRAPLFGFVLGGGERQNKEDLRIVEAGKHSTQMKEILLDTCHYMLPRLPIENHVTIEV